MENFIKQFNEYWDNDTICNRQSIFATGIDDDKTFNIRMILKDYKISYLKLNHILSLIKTNGLKYELEFLFFDDDEKLVHIKVY